MVDSFGKSRWIIYYSGKFNAIFKGACDGKINEISMRFLRLFVVVCVGFFWEITVAFGAANAAFKSVCDFKMSAFFVVVCGCFFWDITVVFGKTDAVFKSVCDFAKNKSKSMQFLRVGLF